MIPGFEKIVEDRIRKAQYKGDFDNLPGAGKPLDLQDDQHIPADLRLAYKILKNGDCLPPEIELKKEILRTEDLLAGMNDTAERYSTLKKLNFLIMKLNATRNTDARFDMPQHYLAALSDRMLTKTVKTDR
jgi:DnaJ homologue, subfamily C, member 28, conserved domain